MVAFTCNACGASVKKAAVEKHYYQCPQTRIVNLTCIDCLQDFNASTYGAHTRCMTENEKYGVKGTVERSSNKGEMKQQDWLSMIADVYKTHPLEPKHKQILEHIMNFDNIPRKKKPFLNFMKSSARMLSKNEAIIESLYDILDKEYKSRNSPPNNAKADSAQNETKSKNVKVDNCGITPTNSETVSEKKKKKKHKHKSESREESFDTSKDAETSPDLEFENNPPASDEASAENGGKVNMSKKEKKEKKKRDKYLTELNEIEKYEKSEEVVVTEEEPAGKKKKDKKNRLKSESEMETYTKTHSEENVADETSGTQLERKLSKKEKKRKISENAAAEGEAKKKHKNLKSVENMPKKEKENVVEDEESQEFIKPDKFKIDKVVKIILQNQGGEVALKRLAKRVCTEYQFRCGVQDADYIMAKFQKKIYNIPGVKILKDKAVLQ